MKIAEQDRAAVREERANKSKMPAAAVKRLRRMAETREHDAQAEAKFVDQFARLRTDAWALRKVLERVSRPTNSKMTQEEVDDHYDRRVLKLRRALAMGWKPQSVSDVAFLAELTPSEQKMPTNDFYEAMVSDWPKSGPIKEPSKRQKVPIKSLVKSMVWRATKTHPGTTGHGCEIAA